MKRESRTNCATGFTLVELLISMVIGGVIIAAIYSTYVAQQRTYTEQEQIVEMQQNIRAAMLILSRDLRMAGFDPTRDARAGFVDDGTFLKEASTEDEATTEGEASAEDEPTSGDIPVASTATQIAFTADLNQDGSLDEKVEDADGDGNVNLSDMEQVAYRLDGTNLQRFSSLPEGDAWQTIAENIEAIEFRYLDKEGDVTANLNKIYAVQVSLLARAGQPATKFLNTETYTPASKVAWDLNGADTDGTAPNDNFRRRLLILTVQCRNMGL